MVIHVRNSTVLRLFHFHVLSVYGYHTADFFYLSFRPFFNLSFLIQVYFLQIGHYNFSSQSLHNHITSFKWFRLFGLFFYFSSWVEFESTWYCDHCLAYCTSPGWWIMMSVEQSVECELAGETEVLGKILPQCHFVNHKSYMTWTGIEPGPPRWESCD
jgi:hypothetical protein